MTAVSSPPVFDTVEQVRSQIGSPLAGWFQFRPLWDQVVASDPDLFG